MRKIICLLLVAAIVAGSATNEQVDNCINQLTIPDNLQFSFTYGVQCNSFHNGIVNKSTRSDAVNKSQWNACKLSMSSHFKDSESKEFYAAVDSCVSPST